MADNGANANIIMGFKAPDMPNPLDTVVKGMTMKNLMQENQSGALKLSEQQRQLSDQSALRNAFKDNTMADENGNPVVNRQGVMSALMKANPMLAQKQALDFRQMDLDKITQQHAIAKQILFGIDPNDQASLDTARAQAQSAGLPPLKLPASIGDPNFGKALKETQMLSLDHGEQLAQANKQQEFALQKQSKDLELAKLNQEQQHYQENKKFDAVKSYSTSVDTARQAPDAAQELKDVLASKKINAIARQAPGGDLDKLNSQQTKLGMMEVVKMAEGSVPTEGELESMTPDTLVQKYGKIVQNLTGKSQPANAGEFLQQGIDYANDIADVGKTSLAARSNRIAERLKPYLGKDQHALIKDQISHEFDDAGHAAPKEETAGKAPASGFSKDVVSYAEKHKITPQQAAAIKEARTKMAGP